MKARKLLLSVSITLAIATTPAFAEKSEGTWHGERTGVILTPSGDNMAFDEASETVHPALTAHSQKMVPGVYKVSDNAYMAWCFGFHAAQSAKSELN